MAELEAVDSAPPTLLGFALTRAELPVLSTSHSISSFWPAMKWNNKLEVPHVDDYIFTSDAICCVVQSCYTNFFRVTSVCRSS